MQLACTYWLDKICVIISSWDMVISIRNKSDPNNQINSHYVSTLPCQWFSCFHPCFPTSVIFSIAVTPDTLSDSHSVTNTVVKIQYKKDFLIRNGDTQRQFQIQTYKKLKPISQHIFSSKFTPFGKIEAPKKMYEFVSIFRKFPLALLGC